MERVLVQVVARVDDDLLRATPRLQRDLDPARRNVRDLGRHVGVLRAREVRARLGPAVRDDQLGVRALRDQVGQRRVVQAGGVVDDVRARVQARLRRRRRGRCRR